MPGDRKKKYIDVNIISQTNKKNNIEMEDFNIEMEGTIYFSTQISKALEMHIKSLVTFSKMLIKESFLPLMVYIYLEIVD